MKVKSESEVAQLCPTLRDPMDCSPPGSSVHGIFQARPMYNCQCNLSFIEATSVSEKVKVKVTQSCPTLCHPMVYTVHGILQARILAWVDFPFSRRSSQPKDWTQVSRTAGGFFTSWATREALLCEHGIKSILFLYFFSLTLGKISYRQWSMFK